MIHLSGYSFFAPPRARRCIDVMRRAGGARSASIPPRPNSCAKSARRTSSTGRAARRRSSPNAEEAEVLAGTDDPEAQGARLAAHYPLVVDQARRGGLRGCAEGGSAGASGRRRRRRWTPPAPATLSSPRSSSPRLAGADRSRLPRRGRRRRRRRRPNSSAGAAGASRRAARLERLRLFASESRLGNSAWRPHPQMATLPDFLARPQPPCPSDPSNDVKPVPPHDGGRRRALRRAFGFGDTSDFDPFLMMDDFRGDDPERLSRRLSLASPSRHRDDHLCAGRLGRARRQPRQSAACSAPATCNG